MNKRCNRCGSTHTHTHTQLCLQKAREEEQI